MKNIVLLSLIFLITTNVYTQKCKYKLYEIDDKTNLPVKITKKETAYTNFNTEGKMSLSNFNNSYSMYFCHVVFSGCVTTYEGCELTFQLKNGEVITLKKGKMDYPLTENEVNRFLKSPIIKIRCQYGDNPGNSKYFEDVVKSKNAKKIMNLFKCII